MIINEMGDLVLNYVRRESDGAIGFLNENGDIIFLGADGIDYYNANENKTSNIVSNDGTWSFKEVKCDHCGYSHYEML